jgi:hypothetical protein
MAQLIQYLFSKHKALGSKTPVPPKTKRKRFELSRLGAVAHACNPCGNGEDFGSRPA